MIALRCQHCDRGLKVKPELAGKKVKCPGCGAIVSVPTEAAVRTQAAPSVNDEQATIPPKPIARDNTESPTQPPPDKSDATQDPSSPDPDHDSSLTDFLAPPQADDELGRLGGFRILKILGHGGMGVVFLGEDPNLGRKVAIKAMLPHLAASKTSQQRFLREAQSAAKLEHDHIVPILQVGQDRGAPFIVMPFLKGEPLDKRLKEAKILPLAETLRIGREIAEALAAAHAAGLIHRDIKPGNIWLETQAHGRWSVGETSGSASHGTPPVGLSRVKVLDFGLARATSEQAGLTQSGAIVGTPAYMAPEQAKGEKVDGRCDLWSLGVVLYRMTTGELPFTGVDSVSTLVAIAMNEVRSVRDLNPEIPEGLAALIAALMKKDANQRTATAGEVVHRLREIEAQLGTSTTTAIKSAPATAQMPALSTLSPPSAEAPPKRGNRRWLLVSGGVLSVALVAAIAFFAFFKPGGDEPVKGVGTKTAPIVPPAASTNLALLFDGKGTVEIPTLRLDECEEITIEGNLELQPRTKGSNIRILGDDRVNLQQYGPKSDQLSVILPGLGGALFLPRPEGRVHIAVVLSPTDGLVFVDGKIVEVKKRIITKKTASTQAFSIGRLGFEGTMDEIRVSKVARYEKDFTPAKRFETDKDTVALYHCDEGEGNVLKDSSGNGHDGKIMGATWVKGEAASKASPLPPAGAYALSFAGENAGVAPLPVPFEPSQRSRSKRTLRPKELTRTAAAGCFIARIHWI